jgi:hypothetical protein
MYKCGKRKDEIEEDGQTDRETGRKQFTDMVSASTATVGERSVEGSEGKGYHVGGSGSGGI